jgi:replicative DNA helicase
MQVTGDGRIDSFFSTQMRDMLLGTESEQDRRSMLDTACDADTMEFFKMRKTDTEIVGIFATRYQICKLKPDTLYLKRLIASKRATQEIQRKGQNAFIALGITSSPTFYLNQRIEDVKRWGSDSSFLFNITALDRATGGVLPGEILVLDGGQGSMKTSLMLKGVETSLSRGARILLFSLDMSPAEIMERRLQAWLNVDQYTIHDMMRNDDDRVKEMAKRIADSDNDNFGIYGNDKGDMWDINRLLTAARSFMPNVLVIDYLTLLQSEDQDDYHCVKAIMPKLKTFAQEYGVAEVLLSQMSRDAKRNQAQGVIGGHSKGGGIVEEIAYTEIELFKDATEDEDELAPLIATVTKTRRGPSGKSFCLEYNPASLTFTGVARRASRDVKNRHPVFNPKGEIII